MPEKLLKITTEYVRNFTALWETDLGWPRSVRDKLAILGLDRLDIIHVLKTGDVVICEKETANGANLMIEGFTCDDVKLLIEVWSDASTPQISLRNVTII